MGSQPNNSSSQSPTSHSADEQDDQTIKLIFLSLIISVGIIGNSVVIVVIKAIRGMRSTTNYFLVNVAVADIFALVFHSIIRRSLSSYHSLSKFAQYLLCKFIITNTMTLIPFAATVLTLTLLAVERYRALVKPMTSSSRLTVDKIAYVITGIWSAFFALVTPLFATIVYHPKVKGGADICNFGNAEGGIIIYIYCFVTILLLVPFIVIAFCYSRIIYCMFIKKTVFNNPSERQATQ